jgi:ligand-binding SRPBCC domain-containing protein
LIHRLVRETFIPRPRSEVFAFFSDAANLERITPRELGFEILTPGPIVMEAGARIEYRIRLFGVPFRWQTLISRWEAGAMFVDEQVKGPYAVWIHTHWFADRDGGTVMGDEVHYRLPLFPLGEIAWPLVRFQLGRIFDFRERTLQRVLAA